MAVNEGTPSAAQRASNSTFYAAMRILPRARREAIFEIYAFCRAVDDIADRDGSRAERLKELQGWRAEVDALYRGAPSARLSGLAIAAARYGLDREDLLAIIDGMEMDVITDIRAPDFESLDLYCDRVASAVGRLCVKVFGMEAEEGRELAHHLGRALQLTNILRDLDEDAAIGRLYLPREALNEAGIVTTDPPAVLAHQGVAVACTAVVERARGHFRYADAIMRHCRRRTVRTPKIMAEAYKLKLAGLARRGWSPPRQAVSTNPLGLMWILARHAIL
jgi:phytoene synthase